MNQLRGALNVGNCAERIISTSSQSYQNHHTRLEPRYHFDLYDTSAEVLEIVIVIRQASTSSDSDVPIFGLVNWSFRFNVTEPLARRTMAGEKDEQKLVVAFLGPKASYTHQVGATPMGG